MSRRTPEGRDIYLGDWLEHFGIGPGEAADIAGCSQSYISNIIAGRKKNVNALYLLPIAEHMSITVNDLFSPLPSNSQIESLQRLSSQAQAALLGRRKAKG